MNIYYLQSWIGYKSYCEYIQVPLLALQLLPLLAVAEGTNSYHWMLIAPTIATADHCYCSLATVNISPHFHLQNLCLLNERGKLTGNIYNWSSSLFNIQPNAIWKKEEKKESSSSFIFFSKQTKKERKRASSTLPSSLSSLNPNRPLGKD